MTTLFRRLQPAHKFKITAGEIAKLLKIPKYLIVRVECWAYVIFVHRLDKGGQFISYRQLQQWQNAVACQIQHCLNWQQLRQIWLEIENDKQQHSQQYNDKHYPFLCQIWAKCSSKFETDPELTKNLTNQTKNCSPTPIEAVGLKANA